jgi:hypothetical protein
MFKKLLTYNIIPKLYNNQHSNICQYTKGCIFGWKITLKICATKVVHYRFGCI